MWAVIRTLLAFLTALLLLNSAAMAEEISDETKACISCHEKITPGIVEDWKRSRHAKTTPAEALKKPKIERRISSAPNEDLMNVVVGCYECHSLNTENHEDSFNHMGFVINVIVSPKDCSECHEEEFEEYMKSVKAHAVENLDKNPVYHKLVETSTMSYSFENGTLVEKGSSLNAQNETCYYCHGTKVTVKGTVIKNGVEVPDLEGWPNQGVGRINPDGSKGACTACHPRHGFSIEVARSPYTCAQCHLEPDVAAFNVWKESKHGNIFLSEYKKYNMSAVPWKIGVDFKAPACAVCHASLVVDKNGDVIAERTHNFDSRIYIRIFGIYAHPQPKDGATWKIKNDQGLPLPTSLTGEPAKDYLIDEQEMKSRKEAMMKICKACHSSDFVEGHFEKFEKTVEESNKATLQATKLLLYAYEKGLANNSNLFDEYIERLWVENWLFYGTSLRHGSAMGGPDYSTFKLGWYQITRNLQEMRDYLGFLEASKKETAKAEEVKTPEAKKSPFVGAALTALAIVGVRRGEVLVRH
ncbi:conserved hypothetical protein [Ferroglobus placidus DSM 10642]|uniref:Cytochrome c-552/4 domain-containing protein n=1 Tax=Ferroglobus placidus (strain DSM 10642 / AEDII12DO) TaxID=589924 RepID=D3RXZ3_FERPA|nr:multiheme c-type cytochrome [Ferroglobus placidus]ADC65356.1 conserved hypothetical protein [Ferroglobus placidus DSM 10642]